MTTESTIVNMGEYIHVMVRGVIETVEDVAGFGRAFAREIEDTGIKRGLIDFRKAHFAMTYFDMVRLAKHIERTGFLYLQPKTAHLVAPADRAKFEEYKTPVFNRGYQPRSFTAKEAALKWLLEE